MKTKVFVTGMGALSSLGNTVESIFQALLQNQSGIQSFPEWKNYQGLHTHLGAPVPAYDISKIPRSARRTMSRMSEMAVLATLDALNQAQFTLQEKKYSPRIALCLGSTTGSPDSMEAHFKKLFEKGGPEGQLGTTFFKCMSHSVVSNVASALGFYGTAISPSSACATSAQAMIMGWELMQTGLYDIVIAGGADELHYTGAAVFDIVMAASRGYNDRPDLSPRPFDLKRDGLVISEGAAVVVLETEESCKRRKAIPLAEFKGGAYSCDGTHMSQSQKSSMVETIRESLDRTQLSPADIHYVNAHATATLYGDQEEAKAIGEVFGSRTPVSSLKGHFGHSLAACGALEVIACIKMIESQTLIRTRNLVEIDPECASVLHLKEHLSMPVHTVLSNNFAFGGINSSLILSKSS